MRRGPDGTTSFSIVQLASDSGNAAALVFFLFDLLYLDGEDLRTRPLIERKERLSTLLANAAPCLHYSDHVVGQGPAFYDKACAMHVEGIVSKRIDAPYTPGNRGLWRKVKCLNRAEFVVVGWTEPEGRRPYLGALLLAYYDPDGRLIYAGRAGTGMNNAELERLWRRLQPLATDTMPLDVAAAARQPVRIAPVLSRVHWVRPELVAEVKFLPGRKTTCCVKSSTRASGRISLRRRSGVRCRVGNPARRSASRYNPSRSAISQRCASTRIRSDQSSPNITRRRPSRLSI